MPTESEDRRGFSLGDPEVTLDRAAIENILAGPDGPVARALQVILTKAENAAKRRCPVDTGRLRASIGTRIERDGLGIVGVIGTNVEYAPPVEFGHTMPNGTVIPPVAFLRGGLDEALAGRSGFSVR
jgi:hypothetical protein